MQDEVLDSEVNGIEIWLGLLVGVADKTLVKRLVSFDPPLNPVLAIGDEARHFWILSYARELGLYLGLGTCPWKRKLPGCSSKKRHVLNHIFLDQAPVSLGLFQVAKHSRHVVHGDDVGLAWSEIRRVLCEWRIKKSLDEG